MRKVVNLGNCKLKQISLNYNVHIFDVINVISPKIIAFGFVICAKIIDLNFYFSILICFLKTNGLIYLNACIVWKILMNYFCMHFIFFSTIRTIELNNSCVPYFWMQKKIRLWHILITLEKIKLPLCRYQVV